MATAPPTDRTPPRPRLWRVADRASFQALRRSSHRARRGAVSVTWLPPDPDRPVVRVAFAVGKGAGGAVARNRIRRRLRSALQELLRDDRLPAGTYLVNGSADVAAMAWPALVATIEDAVAAAGAPS